MKNLTSAYSALLMAGALSGDLFPGPRYSNERPLQSRDITEILMAHDEGLSAAHIARNLHLNQIAVARVVRKMKQLAKKEQDDGTDTA